MKHQNRGSLTVEALILVPALMMLSLVTVFGARLTEATARTQRAADGAARIASQSSNSSMIQRGVRAGQEDLQRDRLHCLSTSVQILRGQIQDIQTVRAVARCELDWSGLSLLGLSRRVVTAQSTEVIDVYTSRSG